MLYENHVEKPPPLLQVTPIALISACKIPHLWVMADYSLMLQPSAELNLLPRCKTTSSGMFRGESESSLSLQILQMEISVPTLLWMCNNKKMIKDIQAPSHRLLLLVLKHTECLSLQWSFLLLSNKANSVTDFKDAPSQQQQWVELSALPLPTSAGFARQQVWKLILYGSSIPGWAGMWNVVELDTRIRKRR